MQPYVNAFPQNFRLSWVSYHNYGYQEGVWMIFLALTKAAEPIVWEGDARKKEGAIFFIIFFIIIFFMVPKFF